MPGAERELEDTVRRVVADFAVGRGSFEFVHAAAAGADDGLANAALRIEFALVVLRRETLVVVVVAAQHDVRAGLEQHAPHVAHRWIAAVRTGAESGDMP